VAQVRVALSGLIGEGKDVQIVTTSECWTVSSIAINSIASVSSLDWHLHLIGEMEKESTGISHIAATRVPARLNIGTKDVVI
jgi:hypothetical protein